MKNLVLLAVALVSFSISQAQVTYGIKVGATVGEISNTFYEQSAHPSIFASIFADIPVAPKFSVQPGVSLIGKGSDFKEKGVDLELEHILSVMTLEIPVNVMYSIPTGKTGKFMVGVGPYIGFNLSGRDNYVGKHKDTKIEVSHDLKFTGKDKDMNVIDAGANFILNYRFTNKLLLSVNYNLGLTDIDPIWNSKQSFRGWAFGVGFQF